MPLPRQLSRVSYFRFNTENMIRGTIAVEAGCRASCNSTWQVTADRPPLQQWLYNRISPGRLDYAWHLRLKKWTWCAVIVVSFLYNFNKNLGSGKIRIRPDFRRIRIRYPAENQYPSIPTGKKYIACNYNSTTAIGAAAAALLLLLLCCCFHPSWNSCWVLWYEHACCVWSCRGRWRCPFWVGYERQTSCSVPSFSWS